MTDVVWLSFADPNLPKGKQFLGVAIIRAPNFLEAWSMTKHLKCNPGGEVQGQVIKGANVPGEYLDRLLSPKEIGELEEIMANR